MISAVILAAGRGSRLAGLTDDGPKCLLPLNSKGETLLDYNLAILKRLGITDLIIVTGYCSEQIEEHCRKRKIEATFVYNPFWNNCNVLGSFFLSFPYIKSDFFFLHADTLAEYAIWSKLASDRNSEIILPFEARDCGEEEMKVRIDNNQLLEISKTIKPKFATGEFIGIAYFQKKSLPLLYRLAVKEFRRGSLNQYMEALISGYLQISRESIKMLDVTGLQWVEIDFLEDFEKAKKQFGS